MINGVNVQQLGETIEAVTADPAEACFEFHIENAWMGGGENHSRIDAYRGGRSNFRRPRPFELVNDEPPVLLGGDKGPNPVEHYLNALAGCLTTSMVYHAAARGMEVQAVRSRLVGDLDLRGFLGLSQEVRKGFRSIRVEFEIEGDLTPSQRQELLDFAEFSPVYDMVRHGVPTTVALAPAGRKAAA